ncbi:Ran-binding protein in the microtubule-organising centre protein [Perilla frutescens var. frutescens]|nr:Ran-binding protein in the microtubule-organising centre protein [Perilla frutescens var. frutescens]
MDSTPLNWEALDALVIDFAKSERLIDDSSPPPPSSSYRWRLLICQIRRSIESGDIDSAIDLLRAYAPAKFIELLRKGTADDRDSAIKCARKSLAPCALDAYPEAYEEFKHALLAFIYDKDDQMSPVVNEWSARRRFEIAGLLSSILRAHLQAYDPIFTMTLRYLISIHKGFCLNQGVPSPIANLTERLLLEERDPPASPQESLFEAPPFDEVDIQALAHAVELTRQGAIDSLRFAKGDLYKAFQNELCRMKVDISVLDELVHEYCIYRGIVDPGPTTSGLKAASGTENADKWEVGSSLSENCSIVTDSDTSVSSGHMEGSQTKMDPVSTQISDMEVRYPCETNSPSEDCSTSRVRQPEDNRAAQRNRSPGTGERGKRKRWRGRDENLEVASEILPGSCSKDGLGAFSLLGCTNMDLEKSMMKNVSNRSDKYEIILSMKELASEGMAGEVVEEINALDPDFFSQNPTLLFQLKQVEFFKLVRVGDHSGALKVASSHLGPLAAKYPALLKPLKETLFALLRSTEEPSGKHLPLDALATSLQVAIGRRFGIEEPQLMKIIRATLHTHREWFKLQMCKDQFEGFLWINSLKEHGSPLLGDAASKSTLDTCTQGSSPVTISSSNTRMQEDGSSSNQISSSNIGCDENAILKVMEFLALPRGDAIHLLAQYNGNAETVIQQIFA